MTVDDLFYTVLVIEFRRICVIGHRPDQIHNMALLIAAIDPGRVIRKLVEVVAESGFGYRLNGSVAVRLEDEEVQVFGVAPSARISGECQPATDDEADSAAADRLNDALMGVPFLRRDIVREIDNGFRDRRIRAHSTSIASCLRNNTALQFPSRTSERA